jgi:hypothetical protein
MEHDFYNLFSAFWWLIFPLFGMGIALAYLWSRHARANRVLDILKSYADQGKDPPPDLMKSLAQDPVWHGRDGWRHSPERRLHRAFVFAALALAFSAMTFSEARDSSHDWTGMLIPTGIFAALAFSNFLSLMFLPRGLPPDDRERR